MTGALLFKTGGGLDLMFGADAGARADRKEPVAGDRRLLVALGLKPAAGLTLNGDFGVTFADAAGEDTVLRSHWNKQATNMVADEVQGMQLDPGNWGRISFE